MNCKTILGRHSGIQSRKCTSLLEVSASPSLGTAETRKWLLCSTKADGIVFEVALIYLSFATAPPLSEAFGKKNHFASNALSTENGSQPAVLTRTWAEEEDDCWRSGRTQNTGLDASSPFVPSASARAIPTWGLQIIAPSLRVRAGVTTKGPGRCFWGDSSSFLNDRRRKIVALRTLQGCKS